VPTALSSTSILNPFFGYPVSYFSASTASHQDPALSFPSSSSASTPPDLRHGRRRKRDLAYTLLRLLWQRWKTHVRAALCLISVAFVLARLWRRARWRVGVGGMREGAVLAIARRVVDGLPAEVRQLAG
jgi:hypothetical protein